MIALVIGSLIWVLAWFVVVVPILGWLDRPLVDTAIDGPSSEPTGDTPQQLFERPAPPGAPPLSGLPWRKQ